MSTNNDKYDFTNCIILGGFVHVLTDEVRECDGIVINNVCTICSLRAECDRVENDPLCSFFEAQDNEYFTEATTVYHDTTTDRYYIGD